MIEIIFEKNIVISHPYLFAVSYFPFWYFLHYPDIDKQKWGCEWASKTKKWLMIILKYFLEQPVIKGHFSHFFFSHWLSHKCFFPFLIKAFSNFEKLIRFYRQAFAVYKNGENLKMLIEIFWDYNVILVFLDHLSATPFPNPWTHPWSKYN